MDEKRFVELQSKAGVRGLSDREADELGRLFAEASGEPYSHAGEGSEGDEGTVRRPQARMPVGRRGFHVLPFLGRRSGRRGVRTGDQDAREGKTRSERAA